MQAGCEACSVEPSFEASELKAHGLAGAIVQGQEKAEPRGADRPAEIASRRVRADEVVQHAERGLVRNPRPHEARRHCRRKGELLATGERVEQERGLRPEVADDVVAR